jgi:hypothetical protein
MSVLDNMGVKNMNKNRLFKFACYCGPGAIFIFFCIRLGEFIDKFPPERIQDWLRGGKF